MNLTPRLFPLFLLVITLFLTLSSAKHHKHHPRRSLSPRTKTAHLLHCLGHDAPHKANRAAVEALIAAYPNFSDDAVWSRLTPREWGFGEYAHTWTVEDERTDKQREKLINCARKVQIDAMQRSDSTASVEAKSKDASTTTEGKETRRVLPDIGGTGFRQVRQQSGLSLRSEGESTFSQNDPQSTAPGSVAAGTAGGADARKPADPAGGVAKTDPAAAGAGDGTVPAVPGQLPAAAGKVGAGAAAQAASAHANGAGAGAGAPVNPATPVDPADPNREKPGQPLSDGTTNPPVGAGQGAATSPVSTADDQKSKPDGTLPPASVPGQKLAPGLGPDSPSVAPALEKDSLGLNMPQPLPGTTAVGQTNPAQPVAADPNHPGLAVTNPQFSTLTAATGVTGNLTNTTVQPGDHPSPNSDAASKLSLAPNSDSSCTNPVVRKEYSTLTRAEKIAFVNAIKCVRSKPSRFKTDQPGWNAADDWTLLHIRMVKYVHFTAYFTVFHRGFLAIVQRDLNECGFDGGLPWVDWTKTSSDPSVNPVFDADPDYGLGTNGKGDNTECPWQTGLAVLDGALADHYFNAPFRHRLCRSFNNLDVNTPSPHFGSNCSTFINSNFISGLGHTHDEGKFFDFSSALEISTHLSMHTCIGGNLAWLSSSPNDVVFHLHHGCMDNMLIGWQNKNEKNKAAFHGPKKQQKGGKHPEWTAKKEDMINFEPLAESVMVKDLLETGTGKWGGRMCYRYDYGVKM